MITQGGLHQHWDLTAGRARFLFVAFFYTKEIIFLSDSSLNRKGTSAASGYRQRFFADAQNDRRADAQNDRVK